MSHHIDDGRVWAVDKRTGEKRRVKRHIIRYSENLVLAPSTRAREEQVTEPEKPKRARSTSGTKRKQATKVAEPKKTSEPAAAAEPATEPETNDSETKEH